MIIAAEIAMDIEIASPILKGVNDEAKGIRPAGAITK